jgi:hypothetical protein
LKKTLTIALSLCATAAFCQFGPELGTESTTSSGLNTPLRNAARTYQAYYAAPAFSTVTSSTVLTGVQFRLALGENWRPAGYVGSTWPDAALNFSDLTITLAKASAGLVSDGEYLSLTPTFASYMVSPTVVRTGSLTINPNTFTATGSLTVPNAWGPTIDFSTNYTFNPGDTLIVMISHTGYGAAGTPLQAFFASRGFQNGLADAISSTTGANQIAPNGFSSPLYMNFTTQVVPEPATFAALGIGAVALLRRRRKGK